MRLGDKLKKNFAKNLQSLRTQHDLTQAKLVDILNEKYKVYDIELQRTSIVNYESEGAMPRIDALYCIAEHFGKTIDQILSSSMDKPALIPQWMLRERGPEPAMPTETGQWNRVSVHADKNALRSSDVNLDAILSTCVDGMLYRQFYTDLLKKLYQQLQESAETDENREKVGILFHKTFLGCLMERSGYFQDLADKALDKHEYQVFMAFKEPAATVGLVAKGLEMTEEEVVTIFTSAQTKIASILEGNSKTNLS